VNDVCATGFSAAQLRDVLNKHKFDCDLSSLESEASVLIITGCDVGLVKYTFCDELKITTLETMSDLAHDVGNLEQTDEEQLLGVIYERYRGSNEAMTGMSANTDELVM
jgi:hypothetical protein